MSATSLDSLTRADLALWSESAAKLAEALNHLDTSRLSGQLGVSNITVKSDESKLSGAVVACIFTMLSLILFAVWAVPEIHDLNAFKSNHDVKITKLENKVINLEIEVKK